ncbi:hypothetical protein NMT40_002010 [Vibrio cholerae]|nr:hypothetical protein [Vibrio cholerae]
MTVEQKQSIDSIAERMLNSSTNSIDTERKSSERYELREGLISYLSSPVEGEQDKVKQLIEELRRAFDQSKFDSLIESTQKGIIRSIVGPFGLGKVLSAYDKTGGNVDTIHNTRQGVYATQEEAERYANRKEYDKNEYHNGNSDYNAEQRKVQERENNGSLIDEATGKPFVKNEDGKTDKNLDHIISAKDIANDPAVVLAEADGATLANRETNLQTINSSVNKTKSDGTTEEFLNKREERIRRKQQRVEELESKETRTGQEENELRNAKNYVEKQKNIDEERLKENARKAQEAYEKELNEKYYGGSKFIKNTAITSVNEGLKMGFQQAVGTLLVEFMSLSFREIKDCYLNGMATDSILSEIKTRINKIASNLKKTWEQVFKDFGSGTLSGILSNLVTVLVNAFVTTGKRVVRMIREGIMSLLNALKVLVFPPEGMTLTEATHEAMKVAFGAATITVGILCEEVIEKMISTIPILTPFSHILSPVIVGSITAICASLIVYSIDKLDLLGIVEIKRNQFVLEKLETKNRETLRRCEDLAIELDSLISKNA